MDLSFLNGKTNSEIYALFTGIGKFSLDEVLRKCAKKSQYKQKLIKGMLIWYIPGGEKLKDVIICDTIKEYISNYEGESEHSDKELLEMINANLKSAQSKINEGKEDELTQDEKDALAADENQDGEITLSSLTDNSGDVLTDNKNSEIQVFE